MKEKIGWIGLGTMGIPMVQRLLDHGYPVTVYNRTKGKEAAFTETGIPIALSPSELMTQTEVVIINMSTVSAGVSKEMAKLCLEQGNEYMDAPVSGSVKQAETGTLVVMAGGEEDVFEQVKPVLDLLSKLAIRVGGHGSGNSAKLAANTLLGIMSQGLAEVILFAQDNYIKPEDMMNIINNSAMGNTYMKIKGEAILQNNYRPAFALKHIAKDLRLAKQSGLNSPLGKTVYKTFQDAEGKFGEQDIIAVIKKIDEG